MSLVTFGISGNKAFTNNNITLIDCKYENYDDIVIKKTERPHNDNINAKLFESDVILSPFFETNRYAINNIPDKKKLKIMLNEAQHQDSGTFVCLKKNGGNILTITWTILPPLPKSVTLHEKLPNATNIDLRTDFMSGEIVDITCVVVADSSDAKYYNYNFTVISQHGKDFHHIESYSTDSRMTIKNSPQALIEFEIQIELKFKTKPLKLNYRYNDAVVKCGTKVIDTDKWFDSKSVLNITRKSHKNLYF